jgi:transglutaminase superfamily protein
MNDEGITSESQSATADRRASDTAAILRRLRRLTAADWRLLTWATVAQVVAAAAVRVLPLTTLRGATTRIRPVVQAIAHASDDRAVWAIDRVGRRLGRLSTCLVRALVAELVVEDTRGLVLTIGVRRAAGRIDAHAWLSRDDRVLIGSPHHDYVPLVEWRRGSP